MSQVNASNRAEAARSAPPNPNGGALVALRPQFIPHDPPEDRGPATQYVVTHTLLGHEALIWGQTWLVGMFSLTEIMGWLPGMHQSWAQALHDTICVGRDPNPLHVAAWEVVRRTDPEGWAAISPMLLPEEWATIFSQVQLPPDAYGASIHGVVRMRDPVLMTKDARGRWLLGVARGLPHGQSLVPPRQAMLPT